MACLHITNGDVVASRLTVSSLGGTVLAWRDVLHDGPVPQRPLSELSAVRAQFLAACGWGRLHELLADFHRRDRLLRSASEFDEIVLWFEHDLYDQLQILQILSSIAWQGDDVPPVRLICIDAFPGIDEFHGLGQLAPAALASLWDRRRSVSPAAFDAACAAWTAFTAGAPTALVGISGRQVDELPFLGAALRRWCEEFPAVRGGLGRSRRSALATLASGPLTPGQSFAAHQRTEPARYLGDWCYWRYLLELASCRVPLIASADAAFVPWRADRVSAFATQRLRLTAAGRGVLAAELDDIDLNGADRWCGGVHLQTADHWRWDQARQCFQHVMLA